MLTVKAGGRNPGECVLWHEIEWYHESQPFVSLEMKGFFIASWPHPSRFACHLPHRGRQYNIGGEYNEEFYKIFQGVLYATKARYELDVQGTSGKGT